MARNLRFNKRIVLLAILCLLVSSCVRSKNPLSDPDRSSADPALFGTWIKRETGATHIVVIGRYGKRQVGVPAGIMTAVNVTISDENEISPMNPDPFFVSKLGNSTYMNRFKESDLFKDGAITPWNRKNISEYQLVKYSVVGDKLDIWEGREEGLAKAIESGALSGTVKREKSGAVTARLDDSTQNLAQFFSGAGADSIFPDVTRSTYTRLAR